MSIAPGVSAKGRTGSGASAASLGVTTQATGSAFVCVCYWGGAQAFVSLVDSKSNTYTQIGTELSSGGDRARLYYVENGVGGASHTATLTVGGTTGVTLFFIEITGGLLSGILDQNGGRTDAASPYTLAAGLTTTQAAELLLSAVLADSGSNPATHAETGLGSSSIQIEETDGSSFWTGALATAVKSATGTFNPSWTETGSSAGMVFLATFKEAAAGGGTTTQKTMTDAVILTDEALDPVRRVRQMSDTSTVTDAIQRLKLLPRTASDALSLTDGEVDWLRFVRQASDALAPSDNTTRFLRFTRRTDETLTLIDSVIKALSGGAGLTYTKVMSDTLVFTDGANRYAFRVRSGADTLSVTDAAVRAALRVRQMSDGAEVTDGAVMVKRLRRVAEDALVVPDELLRQLFLDQLSPTNFAFGAGSVPFVFGAALSPFDFGSDEDPFNFGGQ